MKVFRFTADYTSHISPGVVDELRIVLTTDHGQVGIRHLLSDLPHEKSVIDLLFDRSKLALLEELTKPQEKNNETKTV